MDNILVGISGKPRSGKDSIGEYLKEKHGFYTYAFADYLKWLAITYFGSSKEEMWGKKTSETRILLQGLGTLLTDLDTNFFVTPVVKKIKSDYDECEASGKPFRAVITDVRRLDELSIFKHSNMVFVRNTVIMSTGVSTKNIFNLMLNVLVSRDKDTIIKSEPGMELAYNHSVEALPDTFKEWSYFIDNNGSIEDLHKTIDIFMEDILGGKTNDCNI